MEDYTYDLVPGEEKILGAHMLEVAPSPDDREASARGAPARYRREGRSGAARLHRRSGTRAGGGDERHARPVPPRRQRRRERRRPGSSRSCRSAGRSGSPSPTSPTSAACWLTAGAAHHTVMTTAVGIEVFRDFAEIAGTELLVIDEITTLRGFQQRAPVEPGLLPPRAGHLTVEVPGRTVQSEAARWRADALALPRPRDPDNGCMAQRVETQLVDDVDGSAATQTVRFALDGREYEIDLSDMNAAKLRKALHPYAAAGRRLGARTSTSARAGQRRRAR